MLVDFSQNPSLNEIVSSLAARVDKTDDTGFMDELKHIVNYKRTQAIHEWLVKMPQTWTYFLQSFTVDTESINPTESEDFDSNCFVVKTKVQIPEPLRDNKIKREWQLFDFVGDANGYRSYQWYQPEFIELLRHNKYTSDRKKWYWKNGHIYVIATKRFEPTPIQFRGVFEDALALQQTSAIEVNPDFSTAIGDDAPYPVPRELLNNIIKDVLSTELRVGSQPSNQEQAANEAKVDSIERVQHQNT